MEGKIEISLGAVQIKCEGSEKFLEQELPKLLDAIADFHNKTHDKVLVLPNGEGEAPVVSGGTMIGQEGQEFQFATESICAKVGGKNATEVALAAAAHLHLVQGKTNFSRSELNSEIKKATGYYKEAMGKNLSQTIKSLIGSGKFNKISNGNYELSASERTRIQKGLAK